MWLVRYRGMLPKTTGNAECNGSRPRGFGASRSRILMSEMNEGERLHRRLGPIALMSLGIGATIGTGLYVSTGIVARDVAGPSLMLSFLLAAVGCGFAALCYSELASMVPVAGSAYTYAYATLGELIAWIIGWDLILEYAIGSCFVANGWSGYFDSLLQNVFHIQLDPRLLSPPWDYDLGQESFVLKYVTLHDGSSVLAWFNLPAVFITFLITIVLVIGIKESAGFNAAMVLAQHGRGPHGHRRGGRLRRAGQLASVSS